MAPKNYRAIITNHFKRNKEMKLKIPKSGDKLIGAVRLSQDIFIKIEALAKKHGVSNQEIIRHILINVIDTVE